MSVTIRKIPRSSGIRFKAIVRDKDGLSLRSRTFTTKELARAWARTTTRNEEWLKALGTAAARLTLRQVVAGDPPGRCPMESPDQTRWLIDWWLERLGDQIITDIRPDDVRTALNEYAAGKVRVHVRGKADPRETRETEKRRAPATVNRMRSRLAAIYRHARNEWGLTLESPTKSVPKRKENNARKVFLTEDQAAKLLAAAKDSDWQKLYLLVVMGISTGARRGTLEALRWSAIDFDARTAAVPRTKNGDPIVLTLTPDVVEELRRHRPGAGSVVELAIWKPDGLVFARPGNPYRVFHSRRAWHTALRAAGLTPYVKGMGPNEGFRFHDLRHSAASFLAARGASLLAIGEVLGHRSSQTTKRYSHLLIGAKQKLTDEVFGELLRKVVERGAE